MTACGLRSAAGEEALWAAFFLLGAGFLAPWNAFLTAIDYFSLLFPGTHIDRLFTCAYLPTCLALLLALVWLGDVAWLPSAPARITGCFVGFTLLMAGVPLVDWWAGGPRTGNSSGGSDVALAALLTAVLIAGGLDGACQGAVFAAAAEQSPALTQAVASGTACSGLIISLLRLASKAAWQQGATPAAADLRASTALYFLLSSALTAACAVVYNAIRPRLAHHAPGGACTAASHGLTLQLSDASHSAALGHSDQVLVQRHALHAAHGDAGGPGDPQQPLLAQATPQPRMLGSGPHSKAGGGAGAEGSGVRGLSPRSSLSQRSASWGKAGDQGNAANEEADAVLDVECMESLLRAQGGAGVGSAATRRKAQLTQCCAVLWPFAASLVLTYTCTLAIFPGFLAEDIHSDALGDWYPLLVITAFNVGDMVGKLCGPTFGPPPPLPLPRQQGLAGLLQRALHEAQALPATFLQRPPLLAWLALWRGLGLGALFLAAAWLSAPPWVIIPATLKLGATNGWLTVAAMSGGPLLLPPHLAEPGEGVLVIGLVVGLLVGALMGWLWLLAA